jgi:hypothetical protein
MYKKIYFTGFAIYVVLLVFSIQFARERVIFIDMAYSLFYILMRNSFIISHFRFGDIISQLFPLAAMKAGLPLQAIINFYSVGYIIYSLIAYIICGSVLKRYDFALVVLLQNLLFSSDTFYMQSSLAQSITLIILILAIIADKSFSTLSVFSRIAVFILVLTVAFFHPLGIFVLLFSMGYFYLNKNIIPNKKLLISSGGLYFLILIIKFFLFRTPYDSHSMSGLKNFATLFPDYITLYSNRRFLASCATKYYWIPILLIAVSVYYIAGKKWKNLGFFLIYFFAYTALVNICYPTDATPKFYMENLYLPLGIVLSLPFVLELLPELNDHRWGMGIVLLICFSGLIRIYNTHSFYTARLNYYREILKEYGEKKVVINTEHTNMNLIMMEWGTPYEFLLLSECELNRPASIIIHEQPKNVEWARGCKNVLIVNWNIFPYRELPQRYFKFSDTTTGYYIDE